MRVLTVSEFETKAHEKFKGRYQYDTSKMVNGDSLVGVICPIHGRVEQRARLHLKGKGCRKCQSELPTNALSTSAFLDRARAKWGDTFDYSLVDYRKVTLAVKIVCRTHGEFLQRPDTHLQGDNPHTKCPKCFKEFLSYSQADDKSTFVSRATEIHGDKYDYCLVNYRNRTTKVTITCPDHGSFRQTPSNHISRKSGCPKCAAQENGDRTRHSLDDFIRAADEQHLGRYNYSFVNYVNASTPVSIECYKHGIFKQAPADHKAGHGCPKCGFDNLPGAPSTPFETFVERAKEIYGDRFEYVRDSYFVLRYKTKVICPAHGEFETLPNNFLGGTGCPKCGETRLETFIRSFLDEHKIDYIYKDKSGAAGRGVTRKLELDFYVPSLKTAIETNGIYWHSSAQTKDKGWARKHQKLKHDNCSQNDIRLIQYFEDEILFKPNIVRGHLKNILGVCTDKVFARKTKAVDTAWKEAKEFLDQHHLQGSCSPGRSKALVSLDGQIEAVMVFCPLKSHRGNKVDGVYELLRYASRNRVVGGCSKLLKAFINDTENVRKVVSYSDVRLSDGGMYRKLGFEHVKTTDPDYCYIQNRKRKHKSGFTRSRLEKMLPNFDKSLTEEANCHNAGIYKIYNCGLHRWELEV